MGFEITKKRITHGFYLFTLLSVLGLAAVVVATRSHITAAALARIESPLLLAVLALVAADWLAGGYRIYLFSKVLHPSIRFGTCVKAGLANVFVAAVTPSQTGGGPAQIYLLHAGGMPVVAATSASLMTFFSTTVVLIVAAGAAYLFRGSIPAAGPVVRHLFTVGIALFLCMASLVLLAIVFPGMYREAARGLFVVLARVRRKNYLRAGSRVNRLIDAIDRCHEQIVQYVRREWRVFILGVLVSAGLFVGKFTAAYLIVRSLGAHPAFADVMLLQVVIVLVNYFFPSPGASGAAELSSGALMSTVMATGLVGFYVVLWRLFTTYLSVCAGGLVLLRELKMQERRAAAERGGEADGGEAVASIAR